jgi:hypothetical protein
VDRKSKMFNISESNLHLKSSFIGISGGFINIHQRRIERPSQ